MKRMKRFTPNKFVDKLPHLLSTMRDAVSSTAPSVCATFLGVTLALSLTAVPAQAWAKYTDVSTQYPAAQDLTEVARDGLASIGKSIYPVVVQAGNIVDGTYVVPAYTSSRMCNFYASMADATAKSNPNQVVLNVSGGVVTATFYMSGAYTALYFGTADQAAAIAPGDGLTPSLSYFTDGSDSYDTGHGPFTVQLASLNTSFQFAVYNGGTKGTAGGMWYNRLGSVIITNDFAEAHVMGVSPDPTPSPDPDPDPDPDSGSDGSDEGGLGSGESSNNNASGGGEQNEQQQTSEEQANQEGESAERQESVAGSVMRGKRITIVSADDERGSNSQTVLDGDLLSLEGLTPAQVAALSGALAVLAGAVAFIVRFFLQKRGGPLLKGQPPLEDQPPSSD